MPDGLKGMTLEQVEKAVLQTMISEGITEDRAKVNTDAMGLVDMEMYLADMATIIA